MESQTCTLIFFCVVHTFYILFLYTVMMVFNAVLPEGSKVTDIQCWFLAIIL